MPTRQINFEQKPNQSIKNKCSKNICNLQLSEELKYYHDKIA